MSATVVDSLVVLLGLDASKFTEGQKKALAQLKETRESADTTAKNLQYRGKQGAEFFTLLKDAALGFIGVAALDKMAKWTAGVASGVAAIGRTASNLGMSTNMLAAFGNMIERNGGQAGEAAQSFGTLTQALLQYKLTGQMSDQMMWGLSWVGATGEDSAAEIYKKFNAWSQGKTGPQANMVGGWLGMTQGTINEARKSVADFNNDLAKSISIMHISPADVKNAQEFQQTWTGLAQSITAFGQAVVVLIGPGMISFMNAMTNMILADVAALNYFFPNKPQGVPGPHGSRSASGKIGGAPYRANSGAGKYGTPASILNGLEYTESRGRAGAINPDSGALGAYQFTPGTVTMLRKKYGYTFNPMDKAQSRDAADFYMHKLLQEKGGNMNAALAAYGGFSTKDPSQYIASVMSKAHSVGAGRGTAGGVNSSVTIGTMVVNTKATDADGIARDITTKLRDQNRNLAIAAQANSGMQ